jgi:inositol oxygenase
MTGTQGEDTFRDYSRHASTPGAEVQTDPVAEFYRLNHKYQTLAFASAKIEQYGALNLTRMGIWEACELLNTLVDDSDPDTSLTQIQHLLQTAEAIRHAGHPRWFQLTGLIHDLGKILCLHGEPQWAVVGDTFPLGCAFSSSIVYADFFAQNPDQMNPDYQSRLGVYAPGCGLDKVTMSFGHDEYLYRVTRDYLPREAQYIIRYHSFYSAHSAGAYDYLMNDEDREMFRWVKMFQPFDLYSKGHEPPQVEKLKTYYQTLIGEYFPTTIQW